MTSRIARASSKPSVAVIMRFSVVCTPLRSASCIDTVHPSPAVHFGRLCSFSHQERFVLKLKTKKVKVGKESFTVPEGITLAGRSWVVRYGGQQKSFAHGDDPRAALKAAIEYLIVCLRTLDPSLGLHERSKSGDPRLPVGISGPLLQKGGTRKAYGCFSVRIPVAHGKFKSREVYIGTPNTWSDELVERKLKEAIDVRRVGAEAFKRWLRSDVLLLIPELNALIERL